MEISLLYVNSSYKRVTFSQLLELFLGLQFLKNNQFRIIKYAKEAYLGVKFIYARHQQHVTHEETDVQRGYGGVGS